MSIPAARRPPFWSQALDSLVYPSSYAQTALQPLGRTLGYLAWLIAWYALIVAVGLQIQLVRWARRDGPAWLARLPAFSITHGRVSSPARQPWTYASPDGRLILTLDTTSSVAAIDERHPLGVLLTERRLTIKRGPRTEGYDLDGVATFTYDETIGRRWLDHLTRWGVLLFWLGTLMYLAVTKPVQILLFSVWMMLLSTLLGRGWRYRALWTMGTYALTGPLLLNLLLAWFAPTLPLTIGGALLTAAYGLYLTLAVVQPNPSVPPPSEAALS